MLRQVVRKCFLVKAKHGSQIVSVGCRAILANLDSHKNVELLICFIVDRQVAACEVNTFNSVAGCLTISEQYVLIFFKSCF